jgi:PIN domain nuclease of toxin-antitoxin system
MDYLIDTNIFLWSLGDEKKLKSIVRNAITGPQNQIFISVASLWEISIKHRKGKLPLNTTIQECVESSSFEVLNIQLNHIITLDTLPIFHHDPFDRLLIAQAKAENLTFITSDEKIWKYDLSLLKA